jgi:hypothetical protein
LIERGRHDCYAVSNVEWVSIWKEKTYDQTEERERWIYKTEASGKVCAGGVKENSVPGAWWGSYDAVFHHLPVNTESAYYSVQTPLIGEAAILWV